MEYAAVFSPLGIEAQEPAAGHPCRRYRQAEAGRRLEAEIDSQVAECRSVTVLWKGQEGLTAVGRDHAGAAQVLHYHIDRPERPADVGSNLAGEARCPCPRRPVGDGNRDLGYGKGADSRL